MTMRTGSLAFLILMALLALSCNAGRPGEKENTPDTTAVMGPDQGKLIALNERIANDPGDAEALNDRAMLFLSNGKFNEALRDISNALNVKPDHPPYLITLSDIYFGLNQPQKTRETLLNVLSKDERNTNAMLKLAELNLYYRDYEGVKSYAERALKTDPGLAQAYFILGFASKETGDTATAIRLFRLTADRDPDHLQAYMQLGILMAASSNPLAEEYYKRVLTLDPRSLEAMYNLGMYYQENEMYNEAMKAYHDIISIEPSFRMAYYNLGYIHMAYLGVYSEAVKYFSQAINADPAYIEALYNRGYAYELMGDVMNARKDYERALQIRPNYSLAVDGLNRLDQIDRQVRSLPGE